MVDSNAREDAGEPFPTLPVTATPQERSGEPLRWITPSDDLMVLRHEARVEPHAGWPASHLIGTWELVVADIYALPEGSRRPVITFREDGIFTGYDACYNFSGRYRAGSDWLLSVYDFRVVHKFCFEELDPVRATLLAGLRAAKDFRFEHGTLWIMSQGSKRESLFIFERMDAGLRAGGTGMPPAAGR